DIVHLDSALNTGVDAKFFKCAHESHTVDNGSEHTHVVGGGAVHSLVTGREASPDVAASDDNGDLNAEGMNLVNLCGDFTDNFWRKGVRATDCTEGFAANF